MFRYLTAGESHGPALVGILDGLPAGLHLDVPAIDAALLARQGGYGRGGRMKIETDRIEFLDQCESRRLGGRDDTRRRVGARGRTGREHRPGGRADQ